MEDEERRERKGMKERNREKEKNIEGRISRKKRET